LFAIDLLGASCSVGPVFGNDPWGDGLASWLWKRCLQHLKGVVAAQPAGRGWL